MDPFSATLAIGGFGAQAFGLFGERESQRQQVRNANKQTRLKNQAAMQQWQYNEQMRQREQRQQEQLYQMRVKEFDFQKQLNYDEYKQYYEDSQQAFNQLVRDTRIASLQAGAKLANLQNQNTASALNRGAVGRRAGVANASAQIWAGMEARNRADKLIFADQNRRKEVGRAARKTNLMTEMAFNRIGPKPEALPVAPMPAMMPMQQQASDIGLYSGLLKAGLSGLGTYSELSGKNPFTGNDMP